MSIRKLNKGIEKIENSYKNVQYDMTDEDHDKIMAMKKKKVMIIRKIWTHFPEGMSLEYHNNLNELLGKGKINNIKELKAYIKKNPPPFEGEGFHKELSGGSLKTDLIRKIPDNTYTKTAIMKIVKLIRDGTITDEEQFPLPSKVGEKVNPEFTFKNTKAPEPESESDEEEMPDFNPEFTKFGNLTSLSKDKLNIILNKTDDIDFKVRAMIRNAIKNNKCNSPHQFNTYKPKEKKLPLPKPPKKVKPTEPFFGIPPVPKGKHQASMMEAAKAKQIKYWGVKKADSKVIESMDEKPKEKKSDLQIKMAGLRGKLSRIRREIDASKTSDEKQAKTQEFMTVRDEIVSISDKLSKMA